MSYLAIAGIIFALIALGITLIALRAARRLDRLHRQVLHAREQLGEALLRRAHAAQNLQPFLDPAAAMILKVKVDVIFAAPSQIANDGLALLPEKNDNDAKVRERLAAESELTQVLAHLLSAEEREELKLLAGASTALEALDEANQMVQMTRVFHNTHVSAIHSLRRRYWMFGPLVTGRTPKVQTIDFVDGGVN